ncbi:hypothetical protein AMELA_G00226300 [Ameiurus melas]|uniref:eIF3h C-terminal domain-containing protein n=1 Tax=Ameiurus melas TaxID=219545 RepID=A0A7J6A016_AMEME|nr:hypothetical protein AMELA_G00226300 [Ameiurus melas]
MSQEIVTYNMYCRNLSKQQQKRQALALTCIPAAFQTFPAHRPSSYRPYIHSGDVFDTCRGDGRRRTERRSRGEPPPLPEEDIGKMFKPPPPPPRVDTLLIAGQINNYCQNVKEFTAQNLGKLFMAEALQEDSS